MHQRVSVLLIEDSDDDALLVLRALRAGGLEPAYDRVQTAEEMRVRLARQSWDIIIADYQLPQFSAPAALALLIESGHDIPMVVVSGTIGEQRAVELMRAGVHDYVMKDGLSRLPEVVRRELREAQVRAERHRAEIERQRAIIELERVNIELESIVEQRTAELRATNVQLADTNRELAHATRLKDAFLANMSHELRTPLNVILGMAESLQEETYGELTDRQTRAVATIERSGRHLLQLINDILDLSKIASGKLDLHIAPVRVRLLIDHSLLFIRDQAAKKQIALSSMIDEELGAAEILVDDLRMRQALINLLSNAVKFTPELGAVQLEVALESDSGAAVWGDSGVTEWLTFRVRDTGIGIAPRDIEQLFQPFVQIDSQLNRQQNGTGLGLALVKQIAELHGGRIGVHSELGAGSTFTIALPFNISRSAASARVR